MLHRHDQDGQRADGDGQAFEEVPLDREQAALRLCDARPRRDDGEYLCGDEAFGKQSILDVSSVVQRSDVANWEHLERLWNCTFFHKLGIAQSQRLQHYNVLLTESLGRAESGRRRRRRAAKGDAATQALFESYDTNSIFLQNEAVLSLSAAAGGQDDGHGAGAVLRRDVRGEHV